MDDTLEPVIHKKCFLRKKKFEQNDKCLPGKKTMLPQIVTEVSISKSPKEHVTTYSTLAAKLFPEMKKQKVRYFSAKRNRVFILIAKEFRGGLLFFFQEPRFLL